MSVGRTRVVVGGGLLAVVALVAIAVWWPWSKAAQTDSRAGAASSQQSGGVAAAADGLTITSPDRVAPITSEVGVATGDGADEARRSVVGTNPDTIEFVATCDGVPLAGAQLIVAPVLRDPPWDGTAEPHAIEREQVRGAFTPIDTLVTLVTDEQGRAELRRAVATAAERNIAVATLHHRALTDVRTFDAASLIELTRVEIALASAAPVHITVLGAAAREPVLVTQSALYGDFRLIADYSDPWVSRPLVRAQHTRVGPGDVPLFPADGRHLVVARSGELVSVPYVGPLSGELKLELAPSFQVRGALLDLDVPMTEALVHVQARDAATGSWLDRGLGAMELDGRFERIAVAWLDGASEWRVRVEGIDVFTLEQTFAPSPGGDFLVEFDAPVVVRYAALVKDALTGAELIGAVVTLDWEGRRDPPWVEVAGEFGMVNFGHLPTGVPFAIGVECDGYAPEQLVEPPVDLWKGDRFWVLRMWPACRVTGRIEPALVGTEDLRVEVWRTTPFYSERRRFEVQAVDGDFEFTSVGGESATLHVVSERGSIGPLSYVPSPGDVDLGALALVLHTTASVSVTDGTTGLPIAGAHVVARAPADNGDATGPADEALTDDLGVARLEHFPGNGAWLVVEAPGYSLQWLDTCTWEGGRADFGVVGLEPERVLEVQLDGDPRAPQRFRLTERNGANATALFDERGHIRLGVGAGTWLVALTDSAGRVEELRLDPPLDEPLRTVDWPVPAGELVVRFLNPPSVLVERREFLTLTLAWRGEPGWFERHLPVGVANELLPFRTVPNDEVAYRLHDSRQQLVAWGRVPLPPVGDQELVIDLAGGAANLRVVDVDGAPMSDVYVIGFDRRLPVAGSSVGTGTTDTRGELAVPLLPSGALGLALMGVGAEILPDVDTTDWRAGEVHDVVLAPHGALLVEVMASTPAVGTPTPVAGAHLELRRADDRFHLSEWDADSVGRAPHATLTPADYLLRVEKPGHWSRQLAVRVGSTAATPLTVLLPELATLQLSVRAATGTPLRNTRVELHHQGLDESYADWLADGRVTASSITDTNGQLDLAGVPAGSYSVSIDGVDVGVASTGAGRVTVELR